MVNFEGGGTSNDQGDIAVFKTDAWQDKVWTAGELVVRYGFSNTTVRCTI